jgi:hypothetical protein
MKETHHEQVHHNPERRRGEVSAFNPFREKAIKARALANRLSGGTAHDRGMAATFSHGPGFRHGSVRAAEKRMDATINRAAKCKKATELACYWEARAWEYDNSELLAQQAEEKAEIKLTLNEIIKSKIVPGSTVMNMGGNPMTVKRVNAKSITCTSGTNWKYSEISLPEAIMREAISEYRASKVAA